MQRGASSPVAQISELPEILRESKEVTWAIPGMSRTPTRRLFPLALVIAAALVAALFVVGIPGADAVSHGGAADCEVAEAHNTVKLRATPVATVEAGQQLNGTAGHVWFTSDIFDGTWRLEGPDGVTVGPLESLNGNAIFLDVPLCHEGTWRLLTEHRNLTLSRFQTASASGPHLPGTVLLDHPVETDTDAAYHAGTVENTIPDYEGDEEIYQPAREFLRTNVTLDWVTQTPYHGFVDRIVATLFSEGEDQTHVTSRLLADDGSGTLSTYPGWEAPSYKGVLMMSWGFSVNGPVDIVEYTTDSRVVSVWPESLEDPAGSATEPTVSGPIERLASS